MSTPTTLGIHSPRLAALRELRTKTGRREQQRFAVEGPTMLEEAVRSGVPVETVYATPAALAAIEGLVRSSGAEVFLVPERALERASDLATPPGVIAVVPRVTAALEDLLATGAPALLLAGVADPGNAGTLLRSAEIFGVEQVVFVDGGVEPHHPKVVRASMGAIFRTRIAVAAAEEVLQAAASARYTVVASDRHGTPLSEFSWPSRSLIAIGNERHGVAGTLPRWDAAVAIPQAGRGESLNAAIAGSIVLYLFSQRSDDVHTARKPA